MIDDEEVIERIAAEICERESGDTPCTLCTRIATRVYRRALVAILAEPARKIERVEALTQWRALDGDVHELARALVRALDGVPHPTPLDRYNR